MANNSQSEQKRRRELAEEWAALEAVGALDGEESKQLGCCLNCPISPMPELLADHEEAASAMSLAATESTESAGGEPDPHLKDLILAAVADRKAVTETGREIASPDGFSYSLEEDASWMELPVPGVRMRELSQNTKGPFVTVIIEMDAGSRLAGHSHKGMEEAHVLSGDLECAGNTFHAGDHIFVEAGASHGEFTSPSGCRALVITAQDNYPARTLSAYRRSVAATGWVKEKLGFGKN